MDRMVLGTSIIACVGLSYASQSAFGQCKMMNHQIGAAEVSSAGESENSLKNLKDVVHRVRVAALDLINDVEQRSMVVTGEPDIIQPIAYDDKKPISWAREALELGPALPPRKKWLDVDMAHLGELVKLLQSDFDEANPSAAKQAGANDSWGQMNAIMQDVQTHYKNLQQLTQGPKYDNISIGKAAVEIYDDMSKLSHPWKEALKAARQGS